MNPDLLTLPIADRTLIVRAQQVVTDHRHTRESLDSSTIRAYRTRYAHLLTRSEQVQRAVVQGAMTADAADLVRRPAARATHYVDRRAVNFALCETIELLLAEFGICDKEDDSGTAREILHQLNEYLSALDRVPCDTGRRRLHEGYRSTYEAHPAKPSRTKAGGRADLGRLPADWRERVWSAQAPTSVHRNALAVLWATAARPEEIHRAITLHPGSGEIGIRIAGIKTHGGQYGQPWREIWIAADDHPAARHLSELLTRGVDTVQVACPKSFSSGLGAIWDRIRGRRRVRVSAYSWRHQFAADCKANGRTTAEIAMALGHASDATQRHYGAALQSHGTGGIRITRILAARDIAATTPIRMTQPHDLGSPVPTTPIAG
jgi:integrase